MATFQRDGVSYESKYAANKGYEDLFNNYINYWGRGNDGPVHRQRALTKMDNYVDNFSSQFTNLVGRAPTEDEINSFVNKSGTAIYEQAGGYGTEHDLTTENNALQQYIGTNFRTAAQDVATQKLEAQKTKANELANLFRTQGQQALNDTEGSLVEYQNKLFERLRPNLITSLQAQGLLNTGGLNEAVAGAQGDLATEGSNWLSQRKLDLENQANAIAFSGEAAPYEYERANITGAVPFLQEMSQNAANMNYNTYMDNLNYQHQLGLLAQQNKYARDSQPSFLRTLGQNTASSMGQSFGKWFSPGAGANEQGGGGNYAKLMGMF